MAEIFNQEILSKWWFTYILGMGKSSWRFFNAI